MTIKLLHGFKVVLERSGEKGTFRPCTTCVPAIAYHLYRATHQPEYGYGPMAVFKYHNWWAAKDFALELRKYVPRSLDTAILILSVEYRPSPERRLWRRGWFGELSYVNLEDCPVDTDLANMVVPDDIMSADQRRW